MLHCISGANEKRAANGFHLGDCSKTEKFTRIVPESNVQLRYIVSVISIVNTLLIIMNIYANNRNNVVVVVVFGGGGGCAI